MRLLILCLLTLGHFAVKAQEAETKIWVHTYRAVVDMQRRLLDENKLDSVIFFIPLEKKCRENVLKFQAIWEEQLKNKLKDLDARIRLKMDCELLLLDPVDSTLYKKIHPYVKEK